MDHRVFLRAVDRANVLDAHPGRAAKGDAFPPALARAGAAHLAPLLAGRRVVFVGLGVARAFGFRAPPLTWEEHAGGACATLPHPSGVNLWWNDPANRAAAVAFAPTIFTPR